MSKRKSQNQDPGKKKAKIPDNNDEDIEDVEKLLEEQDKLRGILEGQINKIKKRLSATKANYNNLRIILDCLKHFLDQPHNYEAALNRIPDSLATQETKELNNRAGPAQDEPNSPIARQEGAGEVPNEQGPLECLVNQEFIILDIITRTFCDLHSEALRLMRNRLRGLEVSEDDFKALLLSIPPQYNSRTVQELQINHEIQELLQEGEITYQTVTDLVDHLLSEYPSFFHTPDPEQEKTNAITYIRTLAEQISGQQVSEEEEAGPDGLTEDDSSAEDDSSGEYGSSSNVCLGEQSENESSS